MSHPILCYFSTDRLPPRWAAVVDRARQLAVEMDAMLPDGPDKTAGLEKLLQAKDRFVWALHHRGTKEANKS